MRLFAPLPHFVFTSTVSGQGLECVGIHNGQGIDQVLFPVRPKVIGSRHDNMFPGIVGVPAMAEEVENDAKVGNAEKSLGPSLDQKVDELLGGKDRPGKLDPVAAVAWGVFLAQVQCNLQNPDHGAAGVVCGRVKAG